MLARIFLVWRTFLSHYRQHPAQGVFLLLGLSLGVAMLLGVLIINSAATTAFTSAQKIVGGQAAAFVVPTSGAQTLPESTYVALRRSGVTKAVPRVEGILRLQDGRFVSIQGVDVFAMMQRSEKTSAKALEKTTGSAERQSGTDAQQANAPSQTDVIAFSFPPYQAVISEAYAKALDVKDGEVLLLDDGRRLPRIKIVPNDFGAGYDILCDLRCAQELLALSAKLTSIVFTEITPADTARIKTLLPKRATMFFPEKSDEQAALNKAFFLNLTAIALLAFLVGCFIAFNAVRFSVLQRLAIVRQLRLCGVTFREIFSALALELLFWALAASVIGCLLGWLLAGLLTPSIGLTLTQIFGSENILEITSVQNWWFMALAISLIAAVTATAKPFLQLARHQPLQTAGAKKVSVPLNLVGVFLIAAGGLFTLLPKSQLLGFLISACWFLGGALLIPSCLKLLYDRIGRFRKITRSPKLHWAIEDGKFSHARYSAAMMAFAIAIAAGIAVTTMVGSFRTAFEDYMEQTFSQDLFLRPSAADQENIERFLEQHNGVDLVTNLYATRAKIDQKTCIALALSDHPRNHASVSLAERKDGWERKLHNREGVIVNQTFAFQHELSLGDRMTISINESLLEVEILGVFLNYGNPNAALALDEEWLLEAAPDLQSASLGVYMKNGETADAALETLKSRFQLRSHQYAKPQEMKSLALKIFGQTFQATNLLTIFTLFIAAIGIYCACYAAEIDRERQLTLLKVLGLNHREITSLSLLQLFFNAFVACLIALPLGLLIAWASVHIVLYYSFGWHFNLTYQPWYLAAILIVAILTALSAGLIPLYRLGKKTVITAFREAV